jgi:hypothetical protein
MQSATHFAERILIDLTQSSARCLKCSNMFAVREKQKDFIDNLKKIPSMREVHHLIRG